MRGGDGVSGGGYQEGALRRWDPLDWGGGYQVGGSHMGGGGGWRIRLAY